MTDNERRLAEMEGCANALLQDGVFKNILSALKERAIRRWADTKPADTSQRELHWHDLQAVGRLETFMRELVDGNFLKERKADRELRKNTRDR